jgi:hypothetical protein
MFWTPDRIPACPGRLFFPGLFLKAAIKVSVVFIMDGTSDDFLGKHKLQTAVTDGAVINRLRLSGKNLFGK